MAEVSTVPVYVLANEHLLMWLLKQPLNEEFTLGKRDFLLEFVHLDFHRWNSTRPDHVFQHRWEKFEYDYIKQKNRELRYEWAYAAPERSDRKPSIVLASLQCLMDEYFTVRNNELYIKTEKFGWWQNMLSRLSPLPVLAWAYLKLGAKYAQPIPPTKRTFKQLYPYDEGVENYIMRHGLNDSHVHANLCAYAEECWLHALDHTDEEWKLQSENFEKGDEIPRLYRFIHSDLTPDVMEAHMEIAKVLRYILINYAWDEKVLWRDGETEKEKFSCVEPEGVLAELSRIPPRSWKNTKARELFEIPHGDGGDKENLPNTTGELQWMMKTLEKQRRSPHHLVDRALLLYILLTNEFYMLCVQRDNFVGFRQFQRYSSVQKLLVSQPCYFRGIFERMHGPGRESVTNYVELRISPASDINEFQRQILTILWGYLEYIRHHKDENYVTQAEQSFRRVRERRHEHHGKEPNSRLKAELDIVLKEIDDELLQTRNRLVRPSIVVHLIKRSWEPDEHNKDGVDQIRFDCQRGKYEKRLENVRMLLEAHPKLLKWIRGVDAAAYELDTPPDVFAPAYRKARHELNLPHATYHAGEDFCHLVSGIRAVCEAVDFLELRGGDRIGHATALGVNPSLWLSSMPMQIAPTREEWLLNLLFAWNILQQREDMEHMVNHLSNDIRELGYQIFREPNPSPHLLKRIFDLRVLDPLELWGIYEKGRHEVYDSLPAGKKNFNEARLNEEIIRRVLSSVNHIDPQRREEIKIYQAFIREAPMVIWLLIKWQRDRETWERSQVRIEVPADYFSEDILKLLQQLAMQKLVEKSIVMETLPTSNLRIGQYKEMGQHHSLRWLGVNPCEGDAPPLVVLGTDDPGVFATDIKGEFYHLFASLCKRGVNAQEALEILIRVNQSGERYAFRSLTGNFVEEETSVNANRRAISPHL